MTNTELTQEIFDAQVAEIKGNSIKGVHLSVTFIDTFGNAHTFNNLNGSFNNVIAIDSTGVYAFHHDTENPIPDRTDTSNKYTTKHYKEYLPLSFIVSYKIDYDTIRTERVEAVIDGE